MAGRDNIVAKYKELQASCMAVDCSGQYAILGARKVLAFISLDNPKAIVRKLTRQSKWEVSAVRWNPHPSHSGIFVTASNQRADVYSWEDDHNTSEKTAVKAHTRVISDLDWSPHDPNMLATCSVDTFSFLWDVRDTRKPSLSLQAVAGVSQVKWNKVNSNLIATTHDGDIRIWDPRRGTSPVQYIAGHLSKIHGLDWNPCDETKLATSSQDCTVKFWDVSSPRRPEKVLSSGSPVWRARYTPFGHGLVSVVVPQLRRGENSLFLWNTDDLVQPVHTFIGHTDVVLEFDWRKLENSSDYQLITWSKDGSLRMWKISSSLQKSCGRDDSITSMDGINDNLDTTNDSAEKVEEEEPFPTPPMEPMHKTPPNKPPEFEEKPSPQQPRTLQQEFSLVNHEIPKVNINEMDAGKRTCTVSAISGKYLVKMVMSFPAMYPNNAAPSFEFIAPTTIDKTNQNKLTKVLRDTSLQHVKRSRACLEPCIRQLISTMDTLTMEERTTPDSDTPYNLQQPPLPQPNYLSLASYGSYNDSSIPFPRTSGARFCSTGMLVIFRRPGEIRKSSQTSEVTPRALSALSAYVQTQAVHPVNVIPVHTPQQAAPYNIMFNSRLASSPSENLSISNFYNFKERKQRQRAKSKARDIGEHRTKESPGHKKEKSGPVVLYDISSILPVHKYLAENYSLDSTDLTATCAKNASAAAVVGRRDLVQMWSLVSLALHRKLSCLDGPDEGSPWAQHPFGKNMLKSLIDHYSSLYDVQTLAMLSCIFGALDGPRPAPSRQSSRNNSDRDSEYNNMLQLCWTNDDVVPPINPSRRRGSTLIPQTHRHPPVPLGAGIKLRRSNSWSESFEDYRYLDEIKDPEAVEQEQHEINKRLLEVNRYNQYDQFKFAYAKILYAWELQEKRAEVLKHVTVIPEGHKGIEFVSICHQCHKEVRGVQCGHCKNYGFQCALCHVSVKGASNFCLACGHGGHASHMWEWFKTHDTCPTGCGCSCLTDNPMAD
ncbi:GATOR2 complex protein WDR59-like isoform X2 [Lineus longissimus]|uniref:GATOR2 complex protein WDR59-like isoform X2 n=1 Tax=Lineus longissimus TaxID=88925 RepID=UPI002B4DB12E